MTIRPKRGNGEGSVHLLPSGNWRWEAIEEGQRPIKALKVVAPI